jgi:hypothetical protein
MIEEHGTDEAGGRWTQIDIGTIILDSGTEDGGWQDEVEIFLWRRIPQPIPPRAAKSDYKFCTVINYQGEQLAFDVDGTEKLAEALALLLRTAAIKAREMETTG